MTQTLDQQGRVIFAGFMSSNLMKGTHGICHSIPVPWEPNTWRERQLTVSDLFRFAAISQVSLSARNLIFKAHDVSPKPAWQGLIAI